MTEDRRIQGRRETAFALLALLVAVQWAPHLAHHPPDAATDPASARDRPPGTVLTVIELKDGTTLLADRASPRDGGGLSILRLGLETELEAEALAERPLNRKHFLLGSDHLGRDLLSRLLHGCRNSLFVAGAATLFALVAGTALGLASGYVGGGFDRWAMRLVDISRALPKLFLLLAVAAVREPGPALLALLLAAVSWMSVARLTRAEGLTLRRSEFSDAARAAGCSALRILVHHHLPHLWPMLVTLALTQLSSLILLEAALSFVGAGLAPPTPSLGGLVADAALRGSTAWWTVLFPGLAIVLASLFSRWAGSRLSGTAPGSA